MPSFHCQKPNFTATGSISQSNITASVAPSEITDIAFNIGAGSAGVDDNGLIILCSNAVMLTPEQYTTINQLTPIISGTCLHFIPSTLP